MTINELQPECSVDLGVDGYQVGAFTVTLGCEESPHRVHQSPLCVFRQNEGPVVCLISGVQPGDVIGTTILQNLVTSIDPKNIQGTLIVCPAYTPAQAQCQWSSAERQAIKQAFYDTILSAADVIIEIGSGSTSTTNTPHVGIWPSADETTSELTEAIMFAMGSPDSVRRFDTPLKGSLAELSIASNIVYLRIELGRYLSTDKTSRLMGLSQCQNALLHIGVLTDAHFNLQSTRILETGKSKNYIKAPTSGLVHWHVELGGAVHRGNPIACIYDPHQPFNAPINVNAQINGVLLTQCAYALCTPNQLLAEVADEVPR